MNLGKINLITPPDRLFNLNLSYLLVKPSTKVKMQFQQILTQCAEEINVYIFDEFDEDITWLLSVAQQVDVIIVDIDNCDAITKNFVSFLLLQPNSFYLTMDELTPWALINRGRIFNLDWIVDTLQKPVPEQDDNDEDD